MRLSMETIYRQAPNQGKQNVNMYLSVCHTIFHTIAHIERVTTESVDFDCIACLSVSACQCCLSVCRLSATARIMYTVAQ